MNSKHLPGAEEDPVPIDLGRLAQLADLLRLARLRCEGDLDRFLLLIAVAVAVRDGEPADALGPISGGPYAQSMATALAMPRETVRRKVAGMVEAGWLEREDGRLRLTAEGLERLAPLWPLIAAASLGAGQDDHNPPA
jgi:hypothetical protein